MSNILRGMLAGFIATIVLSGMMVIKTMMGVMPELDVIDMLSNMMGVSLAMGWIAHFMIGTIVWGGGFAILNGAIPGSTQLVKGVIFGIGAWLLMMIGPMPMAGAGLFGVKMGMMAPVMTLILHVVFGAVLGLVYGRGQQDSD